MRNLLVILSLIMLAGCAERRWFKAGGTQQSFNEDRYACMQQSQQRVSNAQVNMYGGTSNSSVQTNWQMYNYCMEARGWELREVPK